MKGMDHTAEEAPLRDPSAVQAKFTKWLSLKSTQNISFNHQLFTNPAFHNPNISAKMLEFMGVNEHGSNFEKAVYDADEFPEGADYEEMGRRQRVEWERQAGVEAPLVKSTTAQHTNTVDRKYQVMLERFHSQDRRHRK